MLTMFSPPTKVLIVVESEQFDKVQDMIFVTPAAVPFSIFDARKDPTTFTTAIKNSTAYENEDFWGPSEE